MCAVAGLGLLRVISVDGSKIWADAAKEATRTRKGCGSCPARCWRRPPPRTASAAATGMATARRPRRGRLRVLCRGDAAGAGIVRPGGAAAGMGRGVPESAHRGRPGGPGGRARGGGCGPAGSRPKPTWRRRGPGRRRRAGYRRTWRCRWRRSRWSRRSPRSRLSATPMTSGSRPLAGAACAAPRPAPPEQAAPCGAAGNGWPPPGRPQGPGRRGRGSRSRAGAAGRGRHGGRASGTSSLAPAGAQHHRPGFPRDALHPQRHRAGL